MTIIEKINYFFKKNFQTFTLINAGKLKVLNKVHGFFNSLILLIFLIISISRIIYFTQDFIINIFPISETYLNYFFESTRNIFEIWKNLII